jgi:hypothetical protein
MAAWGWGLLLQQSWQSGRFVALQSLLGAT